MVNSRFLINSTPRIQDQVGTVRHFNAAYNLDPEYMQGRWAVKDEWWALILFSCLVGMWDTELQESSFFTGSLNLEKIKPWK